MTKNWPICLLASLFLAGCVSSKIQQGGTPGAAQQAASIYLAPYHNATPNPTAGRALTDITATSLMAHGLPLVQSESANAQAAQLVEEGKPHDMLQVAKSVNASHALLCSVHEYRFKSDLDGAPTVGITMRLVDTLSGNTVWQGTGSRAGSYYGSLSKTAQNTIDEMVREMSGQNRRRSQRQHQDDVAYRPVRSQQFSPVYRGSATTIAPTPQAAVAAPPVDYTQSSVTYTPPPVTTTTVNTWEQAPLLAEPVPAEPEFEQIRRRAPKTPPIVAFPTNAPVIPTTPAAPQRGRYDPIYIPAQPQPVWTTRPN